MRTYILTKTLPVLGLVLASISYAQTNTENYVQSKTCLNDDCTRVSEAITYFDGLGRPKQIVSVKSTPSGKDLVTPVTYDGFGRQVKDILPVPAPTQNSMIHTGIVNESAANTYYGVSNAYSEKEMENSPLDRVLQQAAPGDPWKMSSGKTQKLSYDANLGNEVKKFRAVTTPSTVNNVSTGVSALSLSSDNSGYYPASTLYKNTVTDEDGNTVTEFKSGQGQTLLVRRNDGGQNVDTYYVYNDYNQLAYVLSPKAVQQIAQNNNTITDVVVNELCYQYRYDGRSRLVEKKLPGKDWEWMVYDKQDRLVLTQDGMLRTAVNTFSTRGWMFTKYDNNNRTVLTGFYPNSESRTAVQEYLNNLPATTLNNEDRVSNPIVIGGMSVYYRNLAYPSTGTILLEINYYDTYPPEAPAIPATVLGQYTLAQATGADNDASTNSLPTASYVRNIEDTNWTKNYTWYDTMGRAVSTHSINHLGGRTQTESKLDFAGVVQQTITRHKRLDTDTDRVITENFTYDSQNRLLTHTHQVDSNIREFLAQNTYNEISQLTNKKVGGTVALNPLQSIDYAYNIRGWMTKINDPKNLNGKLFGYEIKYNQVEGLETPDALDATLKVLPRYNGNIAEVDWRTGTVQGDYLRRYGYVYDRLNRLSAGFYQADANPSAKEYFEKMAYDVNGNIANLKRSAARGQNTTASAIDNLTYVYANSNTGNRLVSVTDSSGDYRGYPDTSGTAIEYDDPSGNMKSYKDKGILNINYNFLNLPDQITFDQTYLVRNLLGGTTETRNINTKYLYRADGAKMNKIYTYGITKKQSEVLKITEYFDGFQYETEGASLRTVRVLKFVPTAEGYYNFENNKYIYNYEDHLGNVRLSYFNNGSSTEVLEENNYYPFGLKHEDYNLLAGNLSYQYKYNGKELQTESGMYDYGARFYMPDIGRWGVIDPRSQYTHETYSYVWNNPITFADPTGMTGEEVSDWIHNPTTDKYTWDPNVTSQGNTPAGWDYVGKTGSYKIDGATVQLLEGGKTFTDIDEVAVSGVSPAAAGIVLSQNARFGIFAFLAVASWYVISDFVDTNPTQYGTRIDPMMYKHTDNAESDEDKDVNGQDVPKEKKVPASGKTGKEAAKDAPSWAKQKGEAPYVDEDGKTFAERVLDGQYGKGEWNKGKASKGPGSEFNKIKKWGDRGFELPKKK
jgi:RHS repeat-associated protein